MTMVLTVILTIVTTMVKTMVKAMIRTQLGDPAWHHPGYGVQSGKRSANQGWVRPTWHRQRSKQSTCVQKHESYQESCYETNVSFYGVHRKEILPFQVM